MTKLEKGKEREHHLDRLILEAYRKILVREADETGLAHYRSEMVEGRLTPKDLVRHLKSSPEGWLRLFPGEVAKQSLANDALNDREIRAGKTELTSRPYTFSIDLIGRCNMNPPCSMCLDWEGERGPRHHDGLTAADLDAFSASTCGRPTRSSTAASASPCSTGT